MKLIMTKGLPGSGKTSWAKAFQKEYAAHGWKRVNKDDLRNMLDIGKFSRDNEEFVNTIQTKIIIEAFGDSKNVIVDNTNLNPQIEVNLREMCQYYRVEFEIKDFTGVGVEECIRRNALRINKVPERVIYDMNNKYLKKEWKQREYIEGLPDAIIVDIDGTVAVHPHRGHYDYSQVSGDLPRHEIIELVRGYRNQGVKVIFVSGREDSCKEDTWRWIEEHVLPFGSYTCFMRKTGDKRKDSVVKQEIYEGLIKPFVNVRVVFDDRDQVVKMWREQGLVCLQVGEGSF